MNLNFFYANLKSKNKIYKISAGGGEKFGYISRSFALKSGVQRIQFAARGTAIWYHFGQKSLVKAAAFEALKKGGEIAYSIRDDDKAVLYAVSELFL